jgi:acyl-CoA thioester hydrolase
MSQGSLTSGWDLPEPFVQHRQAMPAEIDGYGHVNNAFYVVWLDECAWAHSVHRGISQQMCQQLNRGMAVWRTQINYLKPALEGDKIEVATWPVFNDRRLRIDRRFQIRRSSDGETLVRALIHYVCIDLQTGRPKRLPPEFTRYYVADAVAQAIAAETVPYQPGVEPR